MLKVEVTQLKFVLECLSRKHGKWQQQQSERVDAIRQADKFTEQCKFAH